MQDKIRKQILDAFFVVLRPIAKILLRYGIGFREFAEVAKSAFVDVATSEYGIRGRPTNISRVAVMTGLTRKEVRRLRDALASGDERFALKTTPLGTILHRWYSEDEFLDAEGRPAVLPFAGQTGSFSSLVKRFGGDIPPGAMKTELKRIEAIKEDENGNLAAIRRDVHPAVQHENLCTSLVQSAYPCLANIAHNSNPGRDDSTWVQMTAYSADIRRNDVQRLRRIINDRARESIEAYDDLFIAYEKLNEGEPSEVPTRPIAIGVFYFEEMDDKSLTLWKGDRP